jgi:hypothetical protein
MEEEVVIQVNSALRLIIITVQEGLEECEMASGYF